MITEDAIATEDIMATEDTMVPENVMAIEDAVACAEIASPVKDTPSSKIVKIGTIISDFAGDSQWDIPTFIREQQQQSM